MGRDRDADRVGTREMKRGQNGMGTKMRMGEDRDGG